LRTPGPEEKRGEQSFTGELLGTQGMISDMRDASLQLYQCHDSSGRDGKQMTEVLPILPSQQVHSFIVLHSGLPHMILRLVLKANISLL